MKCYHTVMNMLYLSNLLSVMYTYTFMRINIVIVIVSAKEQGKPAVLCLVLRYIAPQDTIAVIPGTGHAVPSAIIAVAVIIVTDNRVWLRASLFD